MNIDQLQVIAYGVNCGANVKIRNVHCSLRGMTTHTADFNNDVHLFYCHWLGGQFAYLREPENSLSTREKAHTLALSLCY